MFFFFNDTATTEIYTLSLHDALPICNRIQDQRQERPRDRRRRGRARRRPAGEGAATRSCDHLCAPREQARRRPPSGRSEEHTSELQSQSNLVCRLLLEKKKIIPHMLL